MQRQNRLTTRLLEAGELHLYLNHLLRLDRRTRWLRFDHAMDDAAIQAHCLGLQALQTRILGAFFGRDLRAAAELNRSPDGPEGPVELAFSVEPDYQRCGLGTRLMARALDLARPRPAVMLYRASNKGMVALAERTGAGITEQGNHLLCRIETAPGFGLDRLPPPRDDADLELLALTRGYV